MIKYTAVRAVLTAATQSAPVVELADTMDLGAVTLVKGFAPSSPRTFSGKSRLACFYNCGLSVTLRLGFLTESKSEDNKKAADFLPFLSAPVVELADTMDLGAVTLVKGFVPPLTAMILW